MNQIRSPRPAAVPPPLSPGPRRALSVLAAVVAALAGWTLAVPLAGATLAVSFASGRETVSGLEVVVAATASGLASWLLLAALERRTRHARLVWTMTVCTVLVVSLVGPLGADTDQGVATLMALHMLVALILIWGVGGSTRVEPEGKTSCPSDI